MNKDPKRMSEEPSVLGSSVAAMREQQPSDERLAALAARLTAAGAPVNFNPAPKAAPRTEAARPEARGSATSGPAARGTDAVRWGRRALGVGILALGGVGLSTWFGAHQAEPAHHAEEAATIAPGSAPEPPASEAPAEPRAVPEAPRAPLAVQKGARATASAPEPTEATPSDSAAAPSARTAPEPAVTPSVAARQAVAAPPSTKAVPSATAEQASPPARAPSSKLATSPSEAKTGAPLTSGNVVTSELELLKQARSALAVDPAQAYALTERCRAQYPSGDLAQEREYIAISSLVRLGRSSEASSRASLFRMHYPSSAYLPRLARLLGEP